MRRLLIIISLLFSIPLLATAQFPVGSWKRPSNVSPGEYVNNLYDSVTHQCYYTFSPITPALWTNQPAYSRLQRGGPHDAWIIDTLGGIRASGANNVGQDGLGNTTGTTTGAMVSVTTDVNSNPLPPIQDVFMTLNPTNGENWFTLIYSTVASGGLVYVAGCTQDGMSGDGTSGSATQTKFLPVTMPNNDTIVKVEGFQMVLALSNHDSVISWGLNNSAYGLGQGNSPVHSAPGYVHIKSGWHAYDIGGGGIFSYILADSGNHVYHKIFSWGWQYDPGYQGLGPSGTVLTTPQDVTSNAFMSPMTGHTHAVSVTCNTETAYFKCADGTMWDIGGNAVGTIGNGQSLNFAIYTTNPAPYGGTQSWPYAWDESQGELMQDTIYHVLPGVTDIDTIYTGHSNSWFVYVHELNGFIYGWGRNKSTAITANQIDQNNGKSIAIIDADYSNGNIASSYPDSWTTIWPNRIFWPNPAGYEISQTSSPYCLTHGSSSPCNIYTIPTTAPPTASAGSNQTISTSFTNLAGVASGNGGSIVNYTAWSQVSGPNTAVITAPGYQGTQISGLVVGTYTFKDSVQDNNWRTNTAAMTVTVGTGAQTRFYVAALGGGTSCTLSSPCSGSYIQSQTASLVAGDTVSFNSGDVFPYEYVFSVSGSSGNRIIINSYGTGAEPIIGGLSSLSGWTNSGNLWSATWAGPTPTLLSINGVLTSMSRTPNQTSGYSTFIPSAGTTTDINMTSTSLFYPGAHVRVRSSGFTIDSSVVSSLTSTDLTISPAVSYNNVGGNGIILWQNLPDSVTEWRDTAGTIQTYALSTPTNYEVPTIGIPLTLSGSYITVTGIHVSGSDSTNVLITGSNNNLIGDSLDYGMDAIQISSSSNDSINGCYIGHFGDNAVLKKNTSNYNNVYVNNTINDIGMIPGMGTSGNLYQTYCGIIAGDSGNVVKFNTLTNIGYIPIAIYGSSSIADSNYINGFMYTKADGGGIYTYIASQTHTAVTKQITGNVIVRGGLNPSALNGTTLNNSALASAVYLDNYTSNTNVTYNYADSINGPAFFNHGDSNTIIYNQAYGSGYSDLLLAEVGPVVKGMTVKYNIFASGTPTTPAVRITTINNDLPTLGVIDYNIIGSTIGDTLTYWTFSTGGGDPGTFRGPHGWTTSLGYDANTVYQRGRVTMYYNGTGSPFSQSLWTSFTDVDNNLYPRGNTTLAPYSGLILFIYRPGYFVRKRFFKHYYN